MKITNLRLHYIDVIEHKTMLIACRKGRPLSSYAPEVYKTVQRFLEGLDHNAKYVISLLDQELYEPKWKG